MVLEHDPRHACEPRSPAGGLARGVAHRRRRHECRAADHAGGCADDEHAAELRPAGHGKRKKSSSMLPWRTSFVQRNETPANKTKAAAGTARSRGRGRPTWPRSARTTSATRAAASTTYNGSSRYAFWVPTEVEIRKGAAASSTTGT